MPPTSNGFQQSVQQYGVEKRPIAGRGSGLFATHSFEPREQILFVEQPLILALETSQLPTTCYGCLRSSDAQTVTNISDTPESIDLKTCTGCRTVRFCNKTCQRKAWKGYHKHECPIYSKLQPRVLPTTARGIMRLLLQRQNGTISDNDWELLFTLQSHQEQLSQAGGEKWENLLLMTKALKTYSNSPESMDTIARISCTLMVNSFALTTSTMDPIGIVMHPLPALINHSCDPNAIVRFDMSAEASVSPPPKIHHGSISVHALRPIKPGEELRITYIDATIEVTRRQSELKSRYFFTCDCPACWNQSAEHTSPADPKIQPTAPRSSVLTQATDVLLASASPSQPAAAAQPEDVSRIRAALSSLSKTPPPHPITTYPSPQLRHQLVLALMATQDFSAAMRHNMVLHFEIEPHLYKEPWHPCSLVSRWRLFRLVQHCLDEHETGNLEKGDRQARMMLVALAGSLLRNLADDVLGWRSRDANTGEVGKRPQPVGQFELMVAQAQEEMRREVAATGMVAFEKPELAGDWQGWCRGVVDEVLREEAGKGRD